MSFLSNLLIKDLFDEFNFSLESPSPSKLKNIVINQIKNSEENDTSIIEHIDDENYQNHEHEIKYKIFEDINAVIKKGNNIELILTLPTNYNIISINKIKISKKVKNFINDIYLCINNKISLTKDELYNQINNSEKISKIKNSKENKIINNNNNNIINLHILLDSSAVNYIVNKDIFINYSYLINKNKIKYI